MPIYLNNKKIGGVIVTVESSQYTTQDATISSSNQLMAGVTAYGPSGKITGTMPTTSIPNPNLTVSSSGLVTVTLDAVNAGYLNATSAKEATRQLDTIGATTYTPTTTAQVIPSQNYLTGKQTIAGDEDLIASNIKSGVTIFGVEGTYSGAGVSLQTKTATPTESSQEIRPDSGYDGLSKVTVGAISSTYVGSNVARRSSTDLSASGATISVPAGYYNETASKSVASGTAGNPVASKGTVTNHAISITPSVTNTTGYITGGTKTGTAVSVSASELVSGTLSVTTNGTKDVTNYASINVNVASGSTINNQDKTVSPSEDEQTITADSGYTGLGTVTVKAVSEEYVGSAINVDPTITVSGKTVTIPRGYYSTQNTKDVATMTLPTSASSAATSGYTSKATIGRSTADQYINIPTGYNTAGAYYKISAVANGSAGTPTATKGTVSNNTISITPSVTNTTGYITGGTKSGTAVSVSASELVSGTLTINANGTKDVTNYAAVNVNVPTGASINNQNKTVTPTTSTQIIEADVDSNNYTGLGIVTVNPIPTGYILTTDANATASQILLNKTAYVNGEKITGTMPNNGATGGTITSQGGTYTIPAGYTSGGTVTANITAGSLTNTIINGTSFEETSGDYGFRTTVNIPAGYYNATQLTKEFSTILPAPDTEGTSSQVLIGYDLYNHEGQVISGTMSNNGTWNRTLDQTTTSVTIPEGYHSGSGTVSHTTVNIPDPTITVSNSGLITASGSWTRGFTTDNSYSNTQQLTTQTAKTVTPTESEQTAVASGVYTTGTVKVGAISSTYVGSGISQRDSDDLTVSGGTVTAPAGYYSAAASKSVASMTLPTTTSTTATSGATRKATIDRSTSTRYINIPVGYNDTAAYYQISAVANGSVTAPSSISGASATVSTGTNTITLTKSVSVTPNVTTAGYISSGTAGNSSVSLTASVTTKAAATYTPGTTTQTIAANQYLTGVQTIAGDADLIAANIKTGVQIFGVNGTFTADATATASDIMDGETAYVNGSKITGSLVVQTYYTGRTAPAASLGNNGDIYLQS